MSWLFSTTAPAGPDAPNFHPVSELFKGSDVFGELEANDTEWICPGGFTVETHIWYHFLEDGTFVMCQTIHSSIGVWYPTVQFTCKIYNPNTKESVWKSVNLTNFVTPPPGLDKRSSKADQCSITYKDAPGTGFPETYTIRANLDVDLQISLDVVRPAAAPGWKVGNGPKGGHSYFGTDLANPEGHVFHKFWPRTVATGMIVSKGRAMTVTNSPGMFVHAVQGMRPNLVAARWNFTHFQSRELGGASAIQMEFTTTDAYGPKGPGSGFVAVNVGSLVLDGKLVAVTAETKWPDKPQSDEADVISRATHSKTAQDDDTGYVAPTELVFRWAGPSLDAKGRVDATLQLPLGQPDAYDGLVEKVDVLAELPYVVKKMVNYIGTKPYIYQWLNSATLNVTVPEGVIPDVSGVVQLKGYAYLEASYVS